MRLCKYFGRYIPYLLIPFFATVIAFLTWITMTVAGVGADVTELTAILVFLATGSVAAFYIIRCMSRGGCRTACDRQQPSNP